MKKIVINDNWGGFCISREAAEYMAQRGHNQAQAELQEPTKVFYGFGFSKSYEDEYKRDDALLIEVVEVLGEKSWGRTASLKIIEIPEEIDWQIEEYDGKEWVAEKHRKWYS